MELPETSMGSGPSAARERKSRARATGSVLDIAGIPLLLRGTTTARARELTRLFAGVPDVEGAPVADVVYGRRRINVPSRAPDEVYPDLQVWHENDVLHLESVPHGLRGRVTPDHAEISGPGETVLGLRRLLHPVLTHLLAWHGTFVIHAAVVRHRDLGHLVLGDTGQGKSTLALAALEHGWSVLTDDLAAVRVDGDGDGDDIVLRGVPKPLALPGDIDARVTDDAGLLEGDGRRRRHLGAEHLDLRPVALGAVLLVAHGDGPDATVEPVEARDVTSLLFSSFMSTPDPALLRRFFPIGAAVARRPIRRIRHSVDPVRRLEEAARALDIVAHELAQ